MILAWGIILGLVPVVSSQPLRWLAAPEGPFLLCFQYVHGTGQQLGHTDALLFLIALDAFSQFRLDLYGNRFIRFLVVAALYRRTGAGLSFFFHRLASSVLGEGSGKYRPPFYLFVGFGFFLSKPCGVFSDFFVHFPDLVHALTFVGSRGNQPGDELHLLICHSPFHFLSSLDFQATCLPDKYIISYSMEYFEHF